MELNGILVFGVIFLLITLFVGPRLTNRVLEGECHQAYESVETNKKYYKIFLILSSIMIIVGGIMMFL
jgi:hypothetical protein